MDAITKKKFVYEIPQSVDGNAFGPPTWRALHELTENIPCSNCREEAVSFMTFFHDLVNYQLGKKIQDKKNFVSWINKIASLKRKTLILK